MLVRALSGVAALACLVALEAHGAQRLEQAELFVGESRPTADAHGVMVALPDSWDRAKDRQGRDGWYRIGVTVDEAAPEGYALYVPRAGNRLAIWWDAKEVATFGVPTSEGEGDYAKQPLWVRLPADLVHRGANELLVRVHAEPIRNGGLSPVWFGTEAELLPRYESHRRWLVDGSLAVASVAAVLGLLALGLWGRQRDVVYFFFGAASLLWALRVGNVLIIDPPLPRPVWETLIAASYGWYIAFICRFALDVLGASPRIVRAALWVYVAVDPLVCGLAQLVESSTLWTAWLGVNLAVAASVAVVVFREAYTRPRMESILLAIAASAGIAAGARDWIAYRLNPHAYGDFSITRYVSLFFTVAMAWILVDRFVRAMRAYEDLNRDLANRVARRERELIEQFALAAERERAQVLAEERNRIMRDMHDGLGAQLVAALKFAEHERPDSGNLVQQIRECLDTLRVAIDALEPIDGDLATVLGALRYRLAPRFAALGVELGWDIDDLPRLDWLTPGTVHHVQKIVLEAFANVIKHARATRVTVRARHDSARGRVRVELEDNGAGFDAQTRLAGRGLSNMQMRAEAIGGELEVRSGTTGTTLAVSLPLQMVAGAQAR